MADRSSLVDSVVPHRLRSPPNNAAPKFLRGALFYQTSRIDCAPRNAPASLGLGPANAAFRSCDALLPFSHVELRAPKMAGKKEPQALYATSLGALQKLVGN
jgi:hypothetical protein